MPRITTKPEPPSVLARQPVKKETKITEIIEPPAVAGEQEAEPQELSQDAAEAVELRERLRPYDYWEALRRMTKDDWNKVDVYLYRHKGQSLEQTDVVPRGQSWLDKFAEPFTIDYVREHYGGGYYWSRVNCHGTICKSLNFRIEGAPKLEGGVPTATQADPYKDFLIKMVQDQMADIKANLSKPDEAVAHVMDVMNKANDTAIQMLAKQIPDKVDPMQQLTTLLAVLEKAKQVQAPPAVAVTPPADQETGFLKNLEIMERLGLVRKANEDGLSGVAKTIEALKTLGLIPSGGGGAGGTDWKVALAENADKILQHLEGIAARITNAVIAGRQPGPVQVAQRTVAGVRPGATLVGERTAPATAPSPGAQQSPAAPATAATPPGMSEEELIAMANAHVENFLWVRVCDLMKGGESGDNVADMLQKISPELATYLGSQTSEQLEALIAAHPILQQIAGHPRLKAFLEEFRSYFAPEAPEAEEKPTGQ